MMRLTVAGRLACSLMALSLGAQTDPGPRAGMGAGQPLAGLNAGEMASFQQGLARFREVASVQGTEPGATGVGLGPRFNMNSCAGCHAQPSVGGTSPRENPQIAVAKEYGAANTIPSFLKLDGPVRVVRFAGFGGRGGPPGPGGPPGRGGRGRGPGPGPGRGGPDGGVHDLFVVTGRKDAAGCNIAQPNFDLAVQQRNAFFRIPTPVYGAGLIEAISEASIMNNLRAERPLKDSLGIGGHENRNPNDGTITRFGWKAQDKSLVSFAGEALNVEEGITNEEFPHEREDTPGCVMNASPEDHVVRGGGGMSAMTAVSEFMRFLAPPAAGPATDSTERGKQTFGSIGCGTCHTPNLRTGKSDVASLDEKWVPLYSDLALHDMGPGLEDFIDQGQARGRDWRTAPLWGLGQRIYLMHDGRTTDLAQAIREHGSAGSEGYQTTKRFEALTADEKQDLLNFLRSL
jgi:CxxC motif-containing protein (DUF1111 family)